MASNSDYLVLGLVIGVVAFLAWDWFKDVVVDRIIGWWSNR